MERRIAGRKKFRQPIELALSATRPGLRRCKAQGLDINSHGLGLLTDYPLVKGTVLRLAIPASVAGTTLPVFAEVAWANPIIDGLRAGLRFLR